MGAELAGIFLALAPNPCKAGKRHPPLGVSFPARGTVHLSGYVARFL